MKSEPLTEQTIQSRLNHFFASWKYNVDGLFVFSWESDKLIWTKAGYIYEFEIKISRADYKNDFKHKGEKHLVLSSTIAKDCQDAIQQELFADKKRKLKYWTDSEIRQRFGDIDRIVKGKKMPNYFYYVVPEGMIQAEEVPPYAGLIWVQKEYQFVSSSLIVMKQAPKLHTQKYTDGELRLGEKFYYNWRSALEREKKEIEYAAVYKKRLQEELDRQGHDKTWKELELELKIAKSDAEDYKDKWGKALRENILNNAERKRLRHAILQLKPDFDFEAIEQEIEKIYGKRN